MGDISEVSTVEKGSDSLSGGQQGRGQVGSIRRSQRLMDRETGQSVEKNRAENQDIMRKEDPSNRKDMIVAPPVRDRVRARGGRLKGGSRLRRQTRVPRHLANQELSSRCELCGAVLASSETLPEHWVAIHLTSEGVCDICLEDSEDFVEHIKTHLGISDDKVASPPMVTVKAELLENSDFNENVVKEEATEKVGRLVRNPFFSSSSAGSELWTSPQCGGSSSRVNSPGMSRTLIFFSSRNFFFPVEISTKKRTIPIISKVIG